MDGRVSKLSNRVVLIEAEKTLYLVHGSVLLHFDSVRIEILNIVCI